MTKLGLSAAGVSLTPHMRGCIWLDGAVADEGEGGGGCVFTLGGTGPRVVARASSCITATAGHDKLLCGGVGIIVR